MTDEERALNQFLDYLWDMEDFTILPQHPPENWLKKKEATLMGPVGMGDLILAAPAAVYALQYYETVYFPCQEQQEKSVRDFFKHHGRIFVNVLTTKSEMNGVRIAQYDEKDKRGDRLGWGGSRRSRPDISFAEAVYERLGVPYSARWEYDPIPEAASDYLGYGRQNGEYTFVHHNPRRGYAIKERYLGEVCIFPDGDESLSILSSAPLIRHAKRIKVIDSCFLHLCESLPTRDDAVLEYHKYAKPLEDRVNDVDVPTRKNWKVVLE